VSLSGSSQVSAGRSGRTFPSELMFRKTTLERVLLTRMSEDLFREIHRRDGTGFS
jgi:hypothetical protein